MTTQTTVPEAAKSLVWGPTYAEMRDPSRLDPDLRARARTLERDSLDPLNLYNLSWYDGRGQVRYVVLPEALTGVRAPILVLSGAGFPTGSHKVGPAYCCAMEPQLEGAIVPGEHALVWPSTGNYGIGGAWVGPRLGYRSIVVLPEEMSRERYEMIARFGAECIRTVGCESNVKEIYDKVRELRATAHNRILNQFEQWPNYRFHWAVTGDAALAAVADAKARFGVGGGRAAAFVSAMGSAGTIACGDRLKQAHGARIVGLEPVQCPTLYWNGYGGHDIQGIGDKHVTWIHNVLNMDLLCCIDDIECKQGLQVLVEASGHEALEGFGVPADLAECVGASFGISGVCNVLGAIKAAKFYDLGPDDVIVTVATDSIERYRSTMDELTERFGRMDREEAARRVARIFHGQRLDWTQEGTREARERWHNLKYFTWVEQQGRTIEDLEALRDPETWLAEQARVEAVDQALLAARGA